MSNSDKLCNIILQGFYSLHHYSLALFASISLIHAQPGAITTDKISALRLVCYYFIAIQYEIGGDETFGHSRESQRCNVPQEKQGGHAFHTQQRHAAVNATTCIYSHMAHGNAMSFEGGLAHFHFESTLLK